MNKKLFTSESVTSGHPDKICDQISDAILDEYLAKDPYSRVACETMITTGIVIIMGEITSSATNIDIEKIARDTIIKIGYNNSEYGFDGNTCDVKILLDKQSSDISIGVDEKENGLIGAGDQGMMFGYATNTTSDYMPIPISFSHKITRRLQEVREKGIIPYLRPDGKAQVTAEYNEDNTLKRVDAIVVSSQHDKDVTIEEIRHDIRKNVIDYVIPSGMIDENTKIYINPTGRFVIGGPVGDSGLTGRKIIVDTYGGWARHGGGAFSGKDPTKVDRSAAYMARYVAKNVVASGLAKECEIQLSYAIGISEPTSVRINTYGSGIIPDANIADIVIKEFDLTPSGIIKTLNLRRPIYKKTASYGHFGRVDISLPWEETDKAEILKKYI